jgi:predicted transcriptional regulator
MNSALKQMLPIIESWPEEDQEALVEAARRIEAARRAFDAAIARGLADAEAGRVQTIESVFERLKARL